ncbi:M14 family metallopeptidase [Nonlabens ponticola]|uniref:Zinc carboxypeptidase n=1 Tax=Nonlabens ponticola TaxID=2496866 RepID=A0A3S9MXE9_9FLAO|nr:M14 family metallopeptidase [Nonlabens ponticola]AZQ43733.1 zinc carboxypeptidase [Nonlabens ponticola]
MRHLIVGILMVLAFAKAVQAQVTVDPQLDYYLPASNNYNPNIATPAEVIGYVPGKWHVTHDKLSQYMLALADASDRITIENRGTTYEDRPLYLLTITSPANHARIDQIKEQRQQRITGASNDAAPVVIYQGFSIHGNEPSGSNAALLYAYHLAASQDAETLEKLDDVVILLDPSFNPDGLQRFAGWVNQHKSENINPDGNDREYDEVWPGGRTNHYWFDMNRDWLPVQLPESRARIASFNQWMPNVLTDHHEMGTNSSFFFQPGIPSRTNPLTPQINQDLTKEMGNYHAAALDKIGSFYYTEESFDDFYYGKGSTFPDVNGSVGILFEQASSRGHAQNSVNGVLTFPFTIRNQLTAAMSTLEASYQMRDKLMNYQADFYDQVRSNQKSGNIIFGDYTDSGRTDALAEILLRHDIKVQELKSDATIDGKKYKAGYAYMIPRTQTKSKLVDAMFQKITTFQDSLFYDISAWTFPLAFDMDYSLNARGAEAGRTISLDKETGKLDTARNTIARKALPVSQYAYLMRWNEYGAPKVLSNILNAGIRAKVAMQPFDLAGQSYDYGTIMIPVSAQKMNAQELNKRLYELSDDNNVEVVSVTTGLTTGIDLGSNSFVSLDKPNIALVVGDGINPYDAGEIWHLMDQRYDMVVTKLQLENLSRYDLSKYSTIIFPATYGGPEEDVVSKLKSWTRAGGTLIGYRNGLRWMSREKLLQLTFKETENPAKDVTFEQRSNFNGAQVIGGAIFETRLDRSHPIAFGYKDEQLPMFRNTTLFVEADSVSYRNPIKYTNEPLMAGYISKPNLEALKNTVPFKHNSYGRGEVIGFTDNTNFRAFWYGTNKLLMNAIFFSKAM